MCNIWFLKKASLFNGLNNPEVLRLFSTTLEISNPIFFTFNSLFKEDIVTISS